MSRILVKNLPTYLDTDRFRNHFNAQSFGGNITDVKVVSRPDGTSRRFGFIGFKTEQDARKAQEYFDRSFIDATKINVTVVDGSKDAPAPRPNKRRKLSTEVEEHPFKRASKNTDAAALQTEKQSGNTQLAEFLEVMKPRTKKERVWANDEGVGTANSVAERASKPDEVISPDAQREGESDLDWMRRRMKKGISDAERTFDQSDDEQEQDEPRNEKKDEPPEDPTISTILSTSRLFVRNLTFSCTESELESHFSRFGRVAKVHIPVDAVQHTPKGMAYVTFTSGSDAVQAFQSLDGTAFQGRLLHILPAIDRKSKAEEESGPNKKTSYKNQKNATRKVGSGSTFNWAMLYMNSDAVASSIVDQLGIPKADLLSADASDGTSPAAKLALAETHIINETKTYLESEGVLLSSFAMNSQRVARSDTVLLVKNIPYGTSREILNEMFGAYGQIERLLLPPAGTIAVIEYAHADEARKAFKALVFKRLANSIIYLEWAPVGILSGTPSSSAKGSKDNGGPVKTIAEDDAAEKDEAPLSAGTTLFIKNLSFDTTADRLSATFSHLSDFAFARVQTRVDPKRPGQTLSMGYGFVGFKSPEAAQKAIAGMHDTVLDGHKLVVRFAGRGTGDDEDSKSKSSSSRDKKATSTKLLVKNVPFEASKSDLRSLFSSYGALKSVRMPRRDLDRRARGFAFLEFTSHKEAENAYEKLQHTHLLGRHLVLEWADEVDAEEALQKLRAKAGVGLGRGGDAPGKKRKVDLGLDDGRDGDE